ncbi:fimbrial biogenesis outer membrane usher protein, partial [Klebsiella pneumoniae]|nr:fimbrial biogenesis outer membrane usher protein [Klebsiella pneumoniae]
PPTPRTARGRGEQERPGAEGDNVARTVVPTRNAIVKVKYDTRIGYKAMLTLRTRNGVVPFGALVTLANVPGRAVRSNICGEVGGGCPPGGRDKG